MYKYLLLLTLGCGSAHEPKTPGPIYSSTSELQPTFTAATVTSEMNKLPLGETVYQFDTKTKEIILLFSVCSSTVCETYQENPIPMGDMWTYVYAYHFWVGFNELGEAVYVKNGLTDELRD